MKLNAKYISVWENGNVETDCILDAVSGVIDDIEMADVGDDDDIHIRSEVTVTLGDYSLTLNVSDDDDEMLSEPSLESLKTAISALFNPTADSLYKKLCRGQDETGNSLFVSDESSRLAFYSRLSNKEVLMVEYLPENYPAFSIALLPLDENEYISHIKEFREGWLSRKNNLGDIPLCQSGYVDFEE
jgi:hypothetical protein